MKRLFNNYLMIIICIALPLCVTSGWSASTENEVSSPETWATSPHADAASESFTHWNDDGVIPAVCAACHSRHGFLDYIGADGSSVGTTEQSAEVGSVVDCDTCHDDAVKTLSSVTFPSGDTVNDVESSIQCLVCHQGRASTASVAKATGGLAEDVVVKDLQFINVHYRAAAATLYGSEVRGGYQYADKVYTGKFNHVPPFDTCTGCHDAHSLTVSPESCAGCHQADVFTAIRASTTDFDNDDDTSEGIHDEILALHRVLGDTIELYSSEISKTPVLYHADRYPYFFSDVDGNGVLSDEEIAYQNRYSAWTPRLLKAAYNFQFVAKDPGAYAHNPKYILQLLFDSIENLSMAVDVTNEYRRPE